MKTKFALLGAFAFSIGTSQAQSSLTIYGNVDIGYVKENSRSVSMDENTNNRIGFAGVERINNGIDLTFQLEQRFSLTSGQSSPQGDFSGAANIGLQGQYGQIRMGRVNEISTETFRAVDPFYQYHIGGMYLSTPRTEQVSNTARYDSPKYEGFKLAASYTTKSNTIDGNNGYAAAVVYKDGRFYGTINYNMIADSQKTYLWNIGGSIRFGVVIFSGGYEKAMVKNGFSNYAPSGASFTNVQEETSLLALAYRRNDRDTYKFSFAQYTVNSWGSWGGKGMKLALGYAHELSRRTQLYANAIHHKTYETHCARGLTCPDERINGVQLGVTHKF